MRLLGGNEEGLLRFVLASACVAYLFHRLSATKPAKCKTITLAYIYSIIHERLKPCVLGQEENLLHHLKCTNAG